MPRRSRREEVLVAATRLFNRHSFAAVTLEAVASEIGVTPGALYNHFESKEALVFECFARGLRIYRDEIARASEPGLDGLEIVRRFVRGRLRPGEPRMITFSDLDALPRAHRDVVHTARAGNAAMLRSVIAAGVADGSVARCDPFLASLAVFSVLDWMPFWYSESSYYTRQEAAERLDDILAHGVLRRDVSAPAERPASPDIEPLLAELDARDRRGAKRDRLLRIATESFNLRGVVGSALEHIAQDAGVSRGAYYYHARDKAGLLHLCLRRAYRTETLALGHIERLAAGVEGEIARTIATETQLLRVLAALHVSRHGPKTNFHDVSFLAPAQRADLAVLHDALVGRNRGRYDEAVARGTFRPLDTLFVQEVGAGLRNNLPLWSRLAVGSPLEEVADSFSKLFLFGLKPRRA